MTEIEIKSVYNLLVKHNKETLGSIESALDCLSQGNAHEAKNIIENLKSSCDKKEKGLFEHQVTSFRNG